MARREPPPPPPPPPETSPQVTAPVVALTSSATPLDDGALRERVSALQVERDALAERCREIEGTLSALNEAYERVRAECNVLRERVSALQTERGHADRPPEAPAARVGDLVSIVEIRRGGVYETSGTVTAVCDDQLEVRAVGTSSQVLLARFNAEGSGDRVGYVVVS